VFYFQAQIDFTIAIEFSEKKTDHVKNVIINGKITHEDNFLSDLHVIFINRIDLLFDGVVHNRWLTNDPRVSNLMSRIREVCRMHRVAIITTTSDQIEPKIRDQIARMSDREIQISSDYDQYERCASNENQPVRINIRLTNGPTNRNIEIEIGESKDEAFEGDHPVLEENDVMPSLPKMT